MTLIFALFLIGVLLLAIEDFVPGIIVGIIGGLCLLGGVLVAFSQHGATGGLVALAGALLLVGATLYVEFVLLPRTRLARAAPAGRPGTGVCGAKTATTSARGERADL